MNKLSFDFGAHSCFSIEQVAKFVNTGSDTQGFEHHTREFLAAAYAADCCESDMLEEAEAHLQFLADAGAEFNAVEALALLK